MYINPYQNLCNGRWLKANFHTHAGTGPNTCGCNTIDDMARIYKALNYGALCISNHDLFTDTSAWNSENFFMVPGVEYTADPHMLTLGVNRSLRGEFSHQEAINETNRQGGFAVLCHPNWQRKEYLSRAQLDAFTGYAGIEVVNMLITRTDGSSIATDTWDYLLRQGKLARGFGSDDLHAISDAGRGWNEMYVTEDGFGGIKQAVENGALIASTGLSLDFLLLDGNTVRVGAKYPTANYVREFTYRFITENGLVKTRTAKTAKLTLKDENYVRVEVVGENGAMLFTQPVCKAGAFVKP